MPAALNGARLAPECNICYRQLQNRWMTKRKTKTKIKTKTKTKTKNRKSHLQKSNPHKTHQRTRKSRRVRTPLEIPLQMRAQIPIKIQSPVRQSPLRKTTRKKPRFAKNHDANSPVLSIATHRFQRRAKGAGAAPGPLKGHLFDIPKLRTCSFRNPAEFLSGLLSIRFDRIISPPAQM